MDGMRLVASVVQHQTIPPVRLHANRVGLGEGFSVDGPFVYPPVAGKLLLKHQRDSLRRIGHGGSISKKNVVPPFAARSHPTSLAALSRIFHHDAHPPLAIVIIGSSKNPNPRPMHLERPEQR